MLWPSRSYRVCCIKCWPTVQGRSLATPASPVKKRESISFERLILWQNKFWAREDCHNCGVAKHRSSKQFGSAGLLPLLFLLAPAGAVASACCSPGAFGAYVNKSQGTLRTTPTGPFRAPPSEQLVELKPWSWKPTNGAAAELHESWNAEAVLLGTVSPVSLLHAWEVTTGIACQKWSNARDLINDLLDDPVCCCVWNLACILFGCWVQPFSDTQLVCSKQNANGKKQFSFSSSCFGRRV